MITKGQEGARSGQDGAEPARTRTEPPKAREELSKAREELSTTGPVAEGGLHVTDQMDPEHGGKWFAAGQPRTYSFALLS